MYPFTHVPLPLLKYSTYHQYLALLFHVSFTNMYVDRQSTMAIFIGVEIWSVISVPLFMSPFPIGTFIGVGVGAGMLLLLVLLTSVVVLVSVVVVVVVRKRKGANKQKRHRTKGNNLQCNNTVVVMKEMEKKKNGVGPSFESTDIYDTPDGYQYEEKVMHEEGSPMPFPPHEAVERTEHGRIPAPKKPFIPARAEDSCTAMNIHEYDLQMRKMGMTTNGWDGIVVSGEEGEQCVYDDTIELTYQSQIHSALWELSRGSNRY